MWSAAESERRKREGMEAAALARAALLAEARRHARIMAVDRLNGITADDVRSSLDMAGYPDTLGAAWGSVFKGGDWEPTGEWRKSEFASNHSRMLRVWRLRG